MTTSPGETLDPRVSKAIPWILSFTCALIIAMGGVFYARLETRLDDFGTKFDVQAQLISNLRTEIALTRRAQEDIQDLRQRVRELEKQVTTLQTETR